VILGILLTSYPISMLVIVALLILTATQSFMCTSSEGKKIECSQCDFGDRNTAFGAQKCKGISGAFAVALSGFSLPISWLVLCSFHLGKAVEQTGLGKRISLGLLKWMGGSLLGLGYAIFAVECMLAPFIPSNTARGGSIIMPLVMSAVKVASASEPTLGSTTIANPLIETHSKDILDIEFDFGLWLLGAILPGTICIMILPLLLLWLCGKDLKSQSSTWGNRFGDEIAGLGPVSVKEIQVMSVLSVCLVLWMFVDDFGLPEAFIALVGVAALLFMGTISWNDVIRNDKAWDSFFWLSGMILMAEQLSAAGVTHWFGSMCAKLLEPVRNPVLAAMALSLFYFFTMYLFSSLTGHIVAMAPPFMEAGKLLRTPPFLQTGLLAYFSALSGALTNYSSGPTVIYFGQGLISKPRWFLIGLVVSVFYLVVYLSVG
ncbi:hypothetical protein HDU67_002884, partial [Dinochytrium kinnereticum]